MTEAQTQSRRPRVWLVVSLCVNFFLIGLIVAGLLLVRGRMIETAVHAGEGALPPEVVLQLLPPSGATKMCGVVAANTEALRKLGRDLVDARHDLFRVFRSEPFDAPAYKSALNRTTAAQVALIQLRQGIALQVTEKLDATERRELSRELVRRFFGSAQRQGGERPTLRQLCATAGARSAEPLPR